MIKQRVLITGGAGFIGSHLTDELLSRGYRVTVLDNLRNGTRANLKEAFKSEKFSFFQGDILKNSDVERAMKNIDIVFHLACLGVRHSLHSPFENHRVNAEGTLIILEAAKKHKIKQFLYTSSSEIYGGVKTFPINEEATPHPLTVYGASKLAGENYTYAYYKCYGLNTIILRIFNNYGPRAHFEGDAGELIPRSIVNAIYNKSPIIFGDGRNTRDFFYVKDTACVLAKFVELNGLAGKIFNIGTGEEVKINEIVKKILAQMGKHELKIKHLISRPADMPRLWVDTTKFRKLTKYKSSYIFEMGLKETIKYYLELSKRENLLPKIIVNNWQK